MSQFVLRGQNDASDATSWRYIHLQGRMTIPGCQVWDFLQFMRKNARIMLLKILTH